MTGVITGGGSDGRGFVGAVLPPGTIKGTLVIALGGSGMFLEGGAIPLVVPCMFMPVPAVVTAGPMHVHARTWSGDCWSHACSCPYLQW